MLATVLVAPLGALLSAPQEPSFPLQVRLEAGPALKHIRVSVAGEDAEGRRVTHGARTDLEGRVVLDASMLRNRRVQLATSGDFWRLGVGHPAAAIPDAATEYELVLDECLFQVGWDSIPGEASGWRKAAKDVRFQLTQLEPNAVHGWGAGMSCAGSAWGSVLAPAGGRYLVTLDRPGHRPFAALVGSEEAHGTVALRLEAHPESLATYQMSVSGARPAEGAIISLSLQPVAHSEAQPTAWMHARATVGEGGGYGVAVPGRYSMGAEVAGKVGHAFAAVAPSQRIALVDLKASADATLNIHMVPAGGIELNVEGEAKARRTTRLSNVTFEVRRDIEKGSGAQWTRAEVMQIRGDGAWSKPRQLSLATRYALTQSLPAGDYEVRIRGVDRISSVSKVSVMAGEVSQARVTW